MLFQLSYGSLITPAELLACLPSMTIGAPDIAFRQFGFELIQADAVIVVFRDAICFLTWFAMIEL